MSCPRPKSERSTKRTFAPTSPSAWLPPPLRSERKTMMENITHESVAAGVVVPEPTPEEAAQLEQLYRDFDKENLIPLWTEIGDLMPMVPSPKAVPHVWRWN